MGYDLYLLNIPEGVDPRQAVQEMFDREDEDEEAVELNQEQKTAIERLVAGILLKYPNLKRSEFDFADIAQSMEMTEDEARRRNTHVELGDDATGTQIVIWG